MTFGTKCGCDSTQEYSASPPRAGEVMIRDQQAHREENALMQRGQQLDELLRVAAIEGMEKAIAKLGAGLTPMELTALRTLTPQEIIQMDSVRKKLSPLKRAAADNNVGVFY